MLCLWEKRTLFKKFPQKPNKSVKLVHSLAIAPEDEIEFLYEEQPYADEFTEFAIEDTDSESEEEADLTTESDDEQVPILKIQECKAIMPKLPNIEVSILPTKYHVPIKTIAFLDTGAARSMMNPKILPSQYWEPYSENFQAADGRIFQTSLRTKTKIGIRFFPIL